MQITFNPRDEYDLLAVQRLLDPSWLHSSPSKRVAEKPKHSPSDAIRVPADVAPAPAGETTESRGTTLEQLRAAITPIRDSHGAQLKELLGKHGATSLSGLDKSAYGAFLDAVRGLA